MDLVESIINRVACVLSNDTYSSNSSSDESKNNNHNVNESESDSDIDIDDDMKVSEGWNDNVIDTDNRNAAVTQHALPIPIARVEVHANSNVRNATTAGTPPRHPHHNHNNNDNHDGISGIPIHSSNQQIELQLLLQQQQQHEQEHSRHIERVFGNDNHHKNDGINTVNADIGSILSDESDVGSDSDADDLLASSGNNVVVGHVTTHSHLWGDGLTHTKGQCKECDTARLKEQELLFQQLVTVYHCDTCNDMDSKEGSITSSVSSSLSSRSHQCIGNALEEALYKYLPTDVIPLIISFANGEVKPTTRYV
jgi:hypothetical protein